MNKPNKFFKLKKTTKAIMSRIVDTEKRNHFKRMMIDAQIESTKQPEKK